MAKKAKRTARAAKPVGADEVLGWLERRGTKRQIRELERYGITATEPFGVSVGDLRTYAKGVPSDHALALALWDSGRYEARMLAAMLDEPDRVSLSQMNAWAAGFDNWALVDTVCFQLFDRTKHAWKKVEQWSTARREFTKRAAYALIWSLAVHDKEAADEAFLGALPRIEAGADDERHFVKKAVNMALRSVGKRNRALNRAAIELAKRLARSGDATPRWVGSHALRELQGAAVQARLQRSAGTRTKR